MNTNIENVKIEDPNLEGKSGKEEKKKRTFYVFMVVKLVISSAIGGFLFGYDTGIIGGAQLFIEINGEKATSAQI